jgi:hypothetical protein
MPYGASHDYSDREDNSFPDGKTQAHTPVKYGPAAQRGVLGNETPGGGIFRPTGGKAGERAPATSISSGE